MTTNEELVDKLEQRTHRSQEWPDDLRHHAVRFALLQSLDTALAPAGADPCPPALRTRIEACASQLQARLDPRTTDICALIAQADAETGDRPVADICAIAYADILRLACFRRIMVSTQTASMLFMSDAPRP